MRFVLAHEYAWIETGGCVLGFYVAGEEDDESRKEQNEITVGITLECISNCGRMCV